MLISNSMRFWVYLTVDEINLQKITKIYFKQEANVLWWKWQDSLVHLHWKPKGEISCRFKGETRRHAAKRSYKKSRRKTAIQKSLAEKGSYFLYGRFSAILFPQENGQQVSPKKGHTKSMTLFRRDFFVWPFYGMTFESRRFLARQFVLPQFGHVSRRSIFSVGSGL